MRLAFTKLQYQIEHNNKNTCVKETKQNGTVVISISNWRNIDASSKIGYNSIWNKWCIYDFERLLFIENWKNKIIIIGLKVFDNNMQ